MNKLSHVEEVYGVITGYKSGYRNTGISNVFIMKLWVEIEGYGPVFPVVTVNDFLSDQESGDIAGRKVKLNLYDSRVEFVGFSDRV